MEFIFGENVISALGIFLKSDIRILFKNIDYSNNFPKLADLSIKWEKYICDSLKYCKFATAKIIKQWLIKLKTKNPR